MGIWVAVLPRVDQLKKLMPNFWRVVYMPIKILYGARIGRSIHKIVESKIILLKIQKILNTIILFKKVPIKYESDKPLFCKLNDKIEYFVI